jgi:tape measure domain-containing protein
MASKIEAVALAISLDTASFRKEIEYTQRLLNQSKAAFRDVGKVVELLDAALEKNIITEQQHAATVNKATLASEKQQAALRNEAMAVKELTAAREKAAAVELARSRDTLGLGAFAGAQGKPGDRANQFVPDYMRGGNKQTIEELEALRAQALEAQAALEGWANGLKRINLSPLARQINDTRTGAEAWSTGVRKMAEAARATAEEIRRSQAALTGWANGLKQINLSTLAQELQSSRAGAAAWSEGVRKMADAARANAIAVREAQAALEGWANGLERINLSPLARQLQDSRDGAIAWAQGLERAAAAAKAAASAAGQLERQARQGSRTAFNNALGDVLGGNAARDAANATRRQEGLQYLQQFESTQQRVNRQLAEAQSYLSRGAITQNEYAAATRSIVRQNSLFYQGMNQIRGVFSTLLGPLVIAVSAFEALKRSIKLTAELEAARARFKVFLGTVSAANELLRELRELSSTSPVSFAGAQRATSTMLQFGVASDQVLTALKQIAEITGGDTERMNNLALAYAQSAAAGRLMGQELLQMVNAGFNPLKIISEQTGESLVSLKKRMEEGGVSFEEVTKAYRDATKEGGRFNGLLQEIAQTTAGKITRAGSELERFGTAFGEFIKPALDGSLDTFIEDLDRVRQGIELLVKLRDDLSAQGAGPLGKAVQSFFSLSPSSPLNLLGTGADFKAAMKQVEDGESSLSRAAKDRADAIIRLKAGRFGDFLRDDVVSNAKKLVDEYDRMKDLSESIELGDAVTVSDADRAKLEEFNKAAAEARRNAKNITADEFKILREQTAERLKQAKSVEEVRKIQLEGIDKAGEGFYSAESLARAEQWRQEIEASADAAKLLERIANDFKSNINEADSSLIDARYGDRAEQVRLLLKQSVADERILLQGLVDQGAAYDKILASANAIAQAEIGKLLATQAQTKLLEDQAEEAARRKEQDDTLREELKSLQSKAQYLRDIVELGQEEARVSQLMRDDGLNQVEAELRQAAEARLEAEEKIAELRKQAAEFNTSTTAFDKLVNGISELQQLSQMGMIGNDVFNRERNRLVDQAQPNTTAASAPRAIQAGSAEAFAMQANLQAKSISDQIRLADRAFLVQKATADATKKTATTLDELKDNLGALPTP